jgi:hypothetical protein
MPLSFDIGHDPPRIPQLNLLDVEFGNLAPSETAGNEQRQDRAVSARSPFVTDGGPQQRLRLLHGQPGSDPRPVL